jgi:asparagine synthetase B (glutamine-hydrolysing)
VPKNVCTWPCASTAFNEIGALLPNHYLDLKTRDVVRFFPRQPLQQISLEDGTRKISLHLAALLRAVHERFAVFQEITAGLDSRCLLAASREVSKQTTYLTGLWTSIDPSLTEEHRDVRVARNLLRSLGLKHRIVHCPSSDNVMV